LAAPQDFRANCASIVVITQGSRWPIPSGTIAHLKNSQSYLSHATPDLLNTLHRHHDTFRAMLQVNLTVLATAHAVSEGIVRGVNVEMQRRNVPNTYAATGQRAAPSPRNISPLALSRSL
jgi:hypothetical protein